MRRRTSSNDPFGRNVRRTSARTTALPAAPNAAGRLDLWRKDVKEC